LEAEVVVAGNAGVAGAMAGSRTATPNGLLEVGVGIIAPEQVEDGITSLPPPLPTTQQFTEGTNFIPQQQLFFFTGGNVPLTTAPGASASGDYSTISSWTADGSPADGTSTSSANVPATCPANTAATHYCNTAATHYCTAAA